MTTRTRQIVYWSPRVLCILFALFLSLFALDVFEKGWSPEALLGLLIHLIPVYLIIAVLAIAWRREWVGAILFIALALFYVIQTRGREVWLAYLLISGPCVVTGLLFLLNWAYRRELRTR